MSVIAQLVVADPFEADTVLSSDNPTDSWAGFAYKGLDKVRLITLWSLIESTSPDDRFEDRLETVRVIRHQGELRSVETIPAEMLGALASVATLSDDDFDRLAKSWRRTEEFVGWEESEVLDLLRLVGDLADSACWKVKRFCCGSNYNIWNVAWGQRTDL